MNARELSYNCNLRPKKPSSWCPKTLALRRVWLAGSEWIKVGKLGREACFHLSLSRYGLSQHRFVPTDPQTKGAREASVVTLQISKPLHVTL